jgi:hypothetical protein
LGSSGAKDMSRYTGPAFGQACFTAQKEHRDLKKEPWPLKSLPLSKH